MSEHRSILNHTLFLFGRIMLAAIFIIASISKLTHFGDYSHILSQYGMPAPDVLLGISVAFELVGGLLVLLGYKTRFGAILLLLFIIPATFVFHSFWDYQPLQISNQVHHFLKNVSIFGGLLYVLACGPGQYSLDHQHETPVN